MLNRYAFFVRYAVPEGSPYWSLPESSDSSAAFSDRKAVRAALFAHVEAAFSQLGGSFEQAPTSEDDLRALLQQRLQTGDASLSVGAADALRVEYRWVDEQLVCIYSYPLDLLAGGTLEHTVASTAGDVTVSYRIGWDDQHLESQDAGGAPD